MNAKRVIAQIRAFAYGLSDGWRQPHSVGYSHNCDHLYTYPDAEDDELTDTLDKGINVGQFLRAGRGAESYQERYWPFAR